MAQPYFLNPNTGFNPSSAQQMNLQRQPVRPIGNPDASPFSGGKTPQGTSSQPPPWGSTARTFTGQPSVTQPNMQPAAVRPTDQGGPQSAWMQNMATFAGGGLQGSPAFGNQPTGPVRRLVDVLGQQPFGEDNPMTLLMQALQNSKMGLGQDIGLPSPQTTTPPVRTPVKTPGPTRSPFPMWWQR